jgi:hypothetical protein
MASVNLLTDEEMADEDAANIAAVAPAILAEIDTEIALRARLEETLIARLQWASSLKATLQNGQARRS